MDRHSETIRAILKPVYGTEAERWFHRWRLFFLACTERFSYRQGEEWFASHTLWTRGERGGPS